MAYAPVGDACMMRMMRAEQSSPAGEVPVGNCGNRKWFSRKRTVVCYEGESEPHVRLSGVGNTVPVSWKRNGFESGMQTSMMPSKPLSEKDVTRKTSP